MKKNLRFGVIASVVIISGLILIPPFFADKTDAWDAAVSLLPKEQSLIKLCGNDFEIKLSRWFYTFKVSGDETQATYYGLAISNSCNVKFEVKLNCLHYDCSIRNISF